MDRSDKEFFEIIRVKDRKREYPNSALVSSVDSEVNVFVDEFKTRIIRISLGSRISL